MLSRFESKKTAIRFSSSSISFPTKTELLSATEQQLVTIKGISAGKARQITAMLKLATILAAPTHNPTAIRSHQDVFDLLSSEYKHATKENFICLFLNTKID